MSRNGNRNFLGTKVARFERRAAWSVALLLTFGALSAGALGQNLKAWDLHVVSTGTAQFIYEVQNAGPIGFYDILLEIDADADGVFESQSTQAGDPVPGTHVVTVAFPAVQNAAQIRATLNPGNVMFETDYTDNTKTIALTVDLAVVDLVYNATTKVATLDYTVITPSSVVPYNIDFFLDRNGNGTFEPNVAPPAGDGAAVATVGGAVTPGNHTVTGSFAADPPGINQRIFAVLNLANTVKEAVPYNPDPLLTNNLAYTDNSPIIDLVEASLVTDGGAQATFTYAVNSPIPVGPFDITFYLDTNAPFGTWDPGDQVVQTIPIGPAGRTPGTHTVVGDYSGITPANEQFIFAFVDSGNVIPESDETNNIAGTAGWPVDLVAASLDLGTFPQVTLTYVVNAPTAVGPFDVEFYLDTNAPFGQWDPGDLLVQTVPVPPAGRTPGTHTVNGDYTGNVPTNGQLLFAYVNRTGTVVEGANNNPASNITGTAGWPVDLAAGSLALGTGPQATFTYVVNAVAPVGPFDVTFYLDTHAPFGTWDPGDQVVQTIPIGPAGRTPGPHTVVGDYTAVAPADGLWPMLFAFVDSGNVIAESDETNNVAGAAGWTTDLVAASLVLDASLHATCTYTVNSPAAVGPFDVTFYLDTHAPFGTWDPGDQVVETIHMLPADRTPGTHTVSGDYTANPPATNQFIFAFADSGNVIVETDETNNVAATNTVATTDLVAGSVSVNITPTTTEVQVAYAVNSPAPVNPYRIYIGLDTNGDNSIENLLVDLPGNTAPGAYLTAAVDVRPALNAVGGGVKNGYRIVAFVDALNNVAESNKNNNKAFSTLTVDLVAVSIVLTTDTQAGTTSAAVAYTINRPCVSNVGAAGPPPADPVGHEGRTV